MDELDRVHDAIQSMLDEHPPEAWDLTQARLVLAFFRWLPTQRAASASRCRGGLVRLRRLTRPGT